jgi:Cys-tRNA(Pro)/Cys-tRNA(Cys) deacylase
MTIFDGLEDFLARSRVAFVMHTHEAAGTMVQARNLSFDLTRIVKTVAFRTRNGKVVLAAIRGSKRVDYAKLAALLDLKRRDLAPLSAQEVRDLLGVEPGGVSPLALREDVAVFIDDDVLTIQPTIFCGCGRPDRTLEIAPTDLVDLAKGRLGRFSRDGQAM